MGQDTKIEWADHTFNPWVGCAKVSQACTNCYAENWAKRTGQDTLWRGERRRTSAANWRQPLKWNRETPGARVFCASLADVFEAREELIRWRDDLLDLVARTTSLTWLLLTKRPEIAAEYFSRWPVPPNVWMGTTVEDQARADERIPHLLRIPTRVRFLSMEPLLGPVDLAYTCFTGADSFGSMPGIDWVIAGGESGGKARPSHPDWFRSLRDQCQRARVPFLFKQWGEWAVGSDVEANGTDWHGMYEQDRRDGGALVHWWPDSPTRKLARERGRPVPDHNGPIAGDGEVLRVGKAAAGRMLDGRTWDEIPAVRPAGRP